MKTFDRFPQLKLLPLFALYIAVSLFTIDNGLSGDQGRYMMYVENIVNGGYAIDGPLFLWNGPGYPLALLPFYLLGFSLGFLKFINVIFLFCGILFFHKTCLRFFTSKQALLFAYLLGLYYPNISFSLRYLLSEGFAFFLACGLLYLLNEVVQNYSKRNLVLASLFLAFLILTKVIFAYVVIGIVGVLFVLLLFKKFRIDGYRLVLVCVLANLMTLPYLIYTYNLTSEFPYYANSGGQCVYWLSTPYEEEQGEWVHASSDVFEDKPQFENHNNFLSSIEMLPPVEKDRSLKQKAVENIIKHPKKFFKNYINNISRLFLDMPNSYAYQNSAFILLAVPNSFLFVFICISSFTTLLFWKNVNFLIVISAVFALIYLFGSSLLCAYSRMLFPVLPFLFLWIFYMILLWKNSHQNS